MEPSTDIARYNMIEQQLRPWSVLDERVLEVMDEVPREAFLPDAYRGLAYADFEVPIRAERAVPAPKVVGRMLQALDVQLADRVLEVGTGCAYLTACLSRLGAWVVTLETDPVLAAAARERLTALGFDRIEVREADALSGPVAGGPFNVIAVNGALSGLPEIAGLEAQLAPAGRLFCVLGSPPVMTAWLTTRVPGGGLRRESLFETCLPPLAGHPAAPVFEF